jgi:hypothetical protein
VLGGQLVTPTAHVWVTLDEDERRFCPVRLGQVAAQDRGGDLLDLVGNGWLRAVTPEHRGYVSIRRLAAGSRSQPSRAGSA